MSPIDFTQILDTDYPIVDRTRVRPSPQRVATMAHTRTTGLNGEELGLWNDETRPSLSNVKELISEAMEHTLADLPDYLPESIYPRIESAITIKTVCLIETSFYREQSKDVAKHEGRYDKMIASIEIYGGMSSTSQVDAPLARSTMAEYEPDYPIPVPRVLPKMPFSIDGNPDDEGQ